MRMAESAVIMEPLLDRIRQGARETKTEAGMG